LPFCGRQNRDGAKFCSGCGKPLPVLGKMKATPSKRKSNLPVILLIILLILIIIIYSSHFVADEFFQFELPFGENNQTTAQVEGNKDNDIDYDDDSERGKDNEVGHIKNP
jgi:uncharacterized ion transporter superfamily protein YfcC